MKILTVSHNHTEFHPGGTEVVAEGLHAEYGRRDGVSTRLLAGLDSAYRPSHAGTSLQTLPDQLDVTLFRSVGFNVMQMTQSRYDGLLHDLTDYLLEHRPDVIHMHHLIHFGVEFLFLAKKLLPDCKIVLTLHDYYLICMNDGLMVKKPSGARCWRATPDACHGCFPDLPSVVFQVRKLNILKHLQFVDRFASPSKFLKDRFVAWGIEEDRIDVIPNGRAWTDPALRASRPGEAATARNRFGVLGNLRETKGTLVVARAAAQLVEQGFRDFSISLHGAPLFQNDAFIAELNATVARADGRVTLHGRYTQSDLPALMQDIDWVMVPSTWWENAPLAIQDAFAFGRPVLASDLGGVAEAVSDEIDGLHVPAGNVSAWADSIRQAAQSPDLWSRLASGVRAPTTMKQSADSYLALFREISSDAAPGPRLRTA